MCSCDSLSLDICGGSAATRLQGRAWRSMVMGWRECHCDLISCCCVPRAHASCTLVAGVSLDVVTLAGNPLRAGHRHAFCGFRAYRRESLRHDWSLLCGTCAWYLYLARRCWPDRCITGETTFRRSAPHVRVCSAVCVRRQGLRSVLALGMNLAAYVHSGGNCCDLCSYCCVTHALDVCTWLSVLAGEVPYR